MQSAGQCLIVAECVSHLCNSRVNADGPQKLVEDAGGQALEPGASPVERNSVSLDQHHLALLQSLEGGQACQAAVRDPAAHRPTKQDLKEQLRKCQSDSHLVAARERTAEEAAALKRSQSAQPGGWRRNSWLFYTPTQGKQFEGGACKKKDYAEEAAVMRHVAQQRLKIKQIRHGYKAEKSRNAWREDRLNSILSAVGGGDVSLGLGCTVGRHLPKQKNSKKNWRSAVHAHSEEVYQKTVQRLQGRRPKAEVMTQQSSQAATGAGPPADDPGSLPRPPKTGGPAKERHGSTSPPNTGGPAKERHGSTSQPHTRHIRQSIRDAMVAARQPRSEETRVVAHLEKEVEEMAARFSQRLQETKEANSAVVVKLAGSEDPSSRRVPKERPKSAQQPRFNRPLPPWQRAHPPQVLCSRTAF